jgi:hypothetical protein
MSQVLQHDEEIYLKVEGKAEFRRLIEDGVTREEARLMRIHGRVWIVPLGAQMDQIAAQDEQYKEICEADKYAHYLKERNILGVFFVTLIR